MRADTPNGSSEADVDHLTRRLDAHDGSLFRPRAKGRFIRDSLMPERPGPTAKPSRSLTVFGCLAFAVIVTGATVKSYYETDWNFDAVPYVALAYSLTIDDRQEIHRQTFDDFRAAVPPHAFPLCQAA